MRHIAADDIGNFLLRGKVWRLVSRIAAVPVLP